MCASKFIDWRSVEDLIEVLPKGKELKQESANERVNLTEVGAPGPKLVLKEDESKKKLIQLND
jgi:hypothetical protein